MRTSSVADNPTLETVIAGHNESVRSVPRAVPNHKAQIGAFGDPQFSRDRRVEVLINTGLGPVTQSQCVQ
jgi:hypothetical protein